MPYYITAIGAFALALCAIGAVAGAIEKRLNRMYWKGIYKDTTENSH